MLSIFLTFGYAIVIFNIINYKKITGLYQSAARNIKVLLQMNFFTLFNWLSTFMALRYLDPATTICIILAVLSVTIFFISTPLHQLKTNKHLGFAVLLVLATMVFIIKQYINASVQTHIQNVLFGVFWCLVGGVTGAFIGLCSEAMGKAGFSITQILATRFYFLTIMSGLALFFVPHAIGDIVMSWKYYFLASLVIVFFPLIMYQAAIRELGTLIVSLLEPFTPIATYVLQVITGDYHFNLPIIITLIVACTAMMWFMRIEQRVKLEKNADLSY